VIAGEEGNEYFFIMKKKVLKHTCEETSFKKERKENQQDSETESIKRNIDFTIKELQIN
jgi:hypothetical protein